MDGRQLATGCIITIMSCFQFIVSVIVTVGRWTLMSCSLPGVGSLLLSQNKTPTDSLATGPWAPHQAVHHLMSVSESQSDNCPLADLSKHQHSRGSHLSLIQTEGKHWGSGVYAKKRPKIIWIKALFSLLLYKSFFSNFSSEKKIQKNTTKK